MPAVFLVVVFTLPIALAQDSKAVKAGEEVFGANCQMCHNPNSNEDLIGPGLAGMKSGKMPKSGEEVSEKSLMKLIDKGRPDADSKMPPFEEVLSKKEKQALVAYLMTL